MDDGPRNYAKLIANNMNIASYNVSIKLDLD